MIEAFKTLLPILFGFFILALSSKTISKFFKKIGLPGITGMLFTGIMVGPYVLNFLSYEDVKQLKFLNEISLSFIAFYAGTELYLKEIRDKFKTISIEVISSMLVIFIVSTLAFLLLADYIPFMSQMGAAEKLAVALLGGTIFVTRSPSASLAVMKELRAKGHFTKTAISVTVIVDFLVILLFAISLALALNLSSGKELSLGFLGVVLLELALAFLSAYTLFLLLKLVFKVSINTRFKAILLLVLGYGTYFVLYILKQQSEIYLPFNLHVEALLVCILASFFLTNFSNFRLEFQEALQILSPYIYVIFFTITGAHLALDYFVVVWKIALVLFLLRVTAIMLGTFTGASINKESWKYKTTSWTGYVTQAGVGIGLATIVAQEFPVWGYSFYTLILSVIVLNEIAGPALFKLGIKRMGEAHLKHESLETNTRDAMIFGMEPQSVALARQLQVSGWQVQIITRRSPSKLEDLEGVNYINVEDLSLESLKKLDCSQNEAVVLMLDDEENLTLAETIFEEFGNKNVIARIKDRTFIEEFTALGVRVVEPYTSMVNLLDNLVRSPNATSILLGADENQETLDIEIKDKSLHGLQLKFLRLPGDVLILSIKRKDQIIVTHGYTRLRLGDIVTVIGSHQSLEDMSLQFGE